MSHLIIPLLFLVSCTRELPKDLKENRSQLFINEKIISTKLFENSTDYKNRFYDFQYKSNSLLIRGFVTLPRGFDESKKYPVIIYNRGGNRDLGMISEAGIFFDNMSKDKYIVFASQYRGSKGSQGQDQFGGEDIYDVINLVDIIKTYKFVDTKNIFNIGISRGAMMTYIGMKHGLNFNAAVVWGELLTPF